MAIFISDKIDFKSKTVTRDKEGHHIMTEGPISEKDITHTYPSNIRGPKSMKQTLTELKSGIDNITIMTENFKTLYSIVDKSFR